MKRRIVFATGNENKMKEIRMILADLGLEILSMKEAGVFEEIEEDGEGKSTEDTTENLDNEMEIPEEWNE